MNETNNDVELASGFSVSRYRHARDAKDQRAIANAIQARFLERYIEPVRQSEHTHGFAMMAVSCLMIEALESFRQGWASSQGKSKSAFCFFFDSAARFSVFRGHAQEFYEHVRCGILHQAETTGGWLIHRRGPLFDPDTRTINAETFIEELKSFLETFCEELKKQPWDSTEWKHIVTKMDAIAKNCETRN